MIDQPGTDTDRLLRPLDSASAALLRIVGDAALAIGAWPVYQYVQAKLDEFGYDIEDVLTSLPSISSYSQVTYPLNPAPQPLSPLGIIEALDYLDVVWQLHFGQTLAYPPNFERAARLAFDVTTAAEFDGRLSALGEAFKGLDLPGPGAGPLDKMR